MSGNQQKITNNVSKSNQNRTRTDKEVELAYKDIKAVILVTFTCS